MKDGLTGPYPQLPTGRDSACRRFPAVLVAADVRARGSTSHEVVAGRVLDLSYVLPLNRILARGGDEIRKVVCKMSVAQSGIISKHRLRRTVSLGHTGQEECDIGGVHLHGDETALEKMKSSVVRLMPGRWDEKVKVCET